MRKKKRGYKKKALLCFLAFVICFGIFMIPTNNKVVNAAKKKVGVVGLKLYTFNVGSGACSIIKFTISDGTKQYILVDAGTGYKTTDKDYKTTVSNIKKFIKKEGITKFEYVILSHYDSDHIKILRELLQDNKIMINQFVCKQYSKSIRDILQAKNKVIIHKVKALNKKPVCQVYENMLQVKKVFADFDTRITKKSPISPYLDSKQDITIGVNISDGAGGYKAVQVTLKFINKNKSHFSDIDAKKNRGFDYRLASNNDSLVFVLSYSDPKKGNKGNVKKILFCGDIQSNGMNALNDRFALYANDCDLVIWPHHGKVLGSEIKANVAYTQFKNLYEKTPAYRNNFTKTVANGKKTICFVSSDRKSLGESAMDKANLATLNTYLTYGTKYLVANFNIMNGNTITVGRAML